MEELTCSEIFLLNFPPTTPPLLVATSGVNNCVGEGQGFLGIVQESSSSQLEDDRGWEARGREGAGPEKKTNSWAVSCRTHILVPHSHVDPKLESDSHFLSEEVNAVR